VGKIHPAVIAVWAAVVAAGHLLPTVPIWGTGANFSLSHILAPLSGIFFGPLAGALCSAAGGFIGNLIAPNTMWIGLGPFTFIIGTTTAFTTGCIAWGKWPPVAMNTAGSLVINGGIIVYLIGTILWFTQEIGRGFAVYPAVVYGLGFAVTVTANIFVSKIFAGENRLLKSLAIWLCAFGGLIGGATIGNFFALVLLKMPKELWAALTVITPIERAVFAAGATLVGVPLLLGLDKIGVRVGPQEKENKSED
jgi:uncharacterized membrane protein